MNAEQRLIALLHELADDYDEEDHRFFARQLTVPELRTVVEHWPHWAHDGQMAPPGEWRVWLMLAGRGFGKTRAGAEWVSALARERPAARFALVGATPAEVERVMIRGTSGLFAVARAAEDVIFYSTRGLVEFASGATAQVYSGANPDGLRGPEHDFAWCDELAKWCHPEATWRNLMLGLRGSAGARALITTTPRPIALLRRLVADEKVIVVRGRTADNLATPADFRAAMEAEYRGTRFGRQELDGELIEDVAGALWTRALIEQCRAPAPGELKRILIGVDPPASAEGDACGIVVCGLGGDGLGYVLDDRSVRGLSPEGWAREVAAAAVAWAADRVVVETNQGGEMVASVLRSVDVALPVRAVRARFGKGRRAEPVAAQFETGRAKFAGAFPELEDELCGITLDSYEGPGRSPDRADAMVWALAELLLGKLRKPRVRGL
ncbi:MAG TPA: terminase family protein [Allosphingosinicella sp.]|nr:terminase family protein [Allosphingosinicella sp.]